MGISKALLKQAALCVCAAAAAFGGVIDPAGDVLGTYTGTPSTSVDAVSADVIYNPGSSTFDFTATLGGPVSSAPAGTLYVFGLDRGAGTARFGAFNPGVLFDEVLFLRADGSITVNDFINAVVTNLPSGAVVSGNTISASLAASFFPSTGVAPAAYQFNFWPRVGTGNNAQISDFAPNAQDVVVSATPEPGTALMASMALFGVLYLRRRRRA